MSNLDLSEILEKIGILFLTNRVVTRKTKYIYQYRLIIVNIQLDINQQVVDAIV